MLRRRGLLVTLGGSIAGALAGCGAIGEGDKTPGNETESGTPVHTYTPHQPNETEVTVETPNGTTTVTNESTSTPGGTTTTPGGTTTTPGDTTETSDNTTTPANTTTPGNTTETPEDTVTPHEYEPSQINAADIYQERTEESAPVNIDGTRRDIDIDDISEYDSRRDQITDLCVQVGQEYVDTSTAADAIALLALTELSWTDTDNLRTNHTISYNGGSGSWTHLMYENDDGDKVFDAFSTFGEATDADMLTENVHESAYFDDEITVTSSSFDKSGWSFNHPEWGEDDWEAMHENLHQVIYGDAIDSIGADDDFIRTEEYEIGFTDQGWELLESEFENFEGWTFLDEINEEYAKAKAGVQEYEHELQDGEYMRIDANIGEVDDIEEAEFFYDTAELEDWGTGSGLAPSPS